MELQHGFFDAITNLRSISKVMCVQREVILKGFHLGLNLSNYRELTNMLAMPGCKLCDHS